MLPTMYCTFIFLLPLLPVEFDLISPGLVPDVTSLFMSEPFLDFSSLCHATFPISHLQIDALENKCLLSHRYYLCIFNTRKKNAHCRLCSRPLSASFSSLILHYFLDTPFSQPPSSMCSLLNMHLSSTPTSSEMFSYL